MKKKVLSVLLASVMMASVLTGCGEEATTDTATTDTTEVADTTEEAEAPAEAAVISMLYSDNAAYPLNEEWPVLQWIKEEANVVLDLQPVPESDWDAKKEIVLNSPDMPDIIARSFATSTDVASGILLPISKYEDRMPNFQKYVEEKGLRTALEAQRFSDGNYYTLPCKSRDSKVQDQQWLIRTDIFEKNGIKVPTTMEEVYEAGLKLKEIYPDSTPITNRFGEANIYTGFASAFGTIAGWTIGDGMYYDYDAAEWVYAPTTDGYKQMLEYVAKLVKDGVLDQEFGTLDSTVYEQRIVQGETFMMYDWTGNIDRYNKQGVELDPDYNVTPIYPPEGSEGNYGVGWKQFWDQGYILSASLADDEEHLNEVLAYLDWGYTDEAQVLLTFGKEGETYKLNENGNMVYLDETIDYSAAYGLDNNSFCIRENTDFLYGKLNAEQVALFEQIAADNVVPMTNPQSPLSPDELEESQIYTGTLLDYVNQVTASVVYGKDDAPAWDDFVAECEAKGSTKLVELYNK